jgi:hypothetical protein
MILSKLKQEENFSYEYYSLTENKIIYMKSDYYFQLQMNFEILKQQIQFLQQYLQLI